MSIEYCSSGCDLPIIGPSNDPKSKINIKGKGEIFVSKADVLGVDEYTVERKEYTPPQITAEANPTAEVGALVDYTWNVNIIKGRDNIVRRDMTPQTSPASNLNLPFSITIDDETQAGRGLKLLHTIEAEDEIGTITTRQLGINFYNNVMRGYSYKDGVTSGQLLTSGDLTPFTKSLVKNVKDQYGGSKLYTIPVSAVGQYIYWLYELGTVPFNALELSGLPFPFIILGGTLAFTNANGVSVSYVVARSSNKYGTGNLNINML